MHRQNSDNDYLLLDSTAFIHDFHDKDRFINFRRATKGQELLCGMDNIIIEGWEEISSSLRIEDQTLILIPKEII